MRNIPAKENIFLPFTKRAKITKCIQQALEPVGRTKETIAEQKMGEFDEYVHDLATGIAPFVDEAVISVMTSALKDLDYDFQNFDADDKKQQEALTNEVASRIENACKNILDLDGAKDINSAKFIQKSLPALFEKKSMSKEKRQEFESLIAQLDKKAGMLSPFLTTRVTALKIWAPERVIENYVIYKKNSAILSKLLSSPIADDIIREWPDAENATALNSYNGILTQGCIDNYNLMISGTQSEQKMEKKGVRNIVSEYNTKVNGNSRKGLPMPKKLRKQVLAPVAKRFTVNAVTNDAAALELMEGAFKQAAENTEALMEALAQMVPEDITIPYSMLHTISHNLYGDHSAIPQAVNQMEFGSLAERLTNPKITKKERNSIMKQMEDPEKAFRKKQYLFSDIQELMENDRIFDRYLSVLREEFAQAKYRSGIALDALRKSGSMKDKESIATAQAAFSSWSAVKTLLAAARRNSDEQGSDYFYSLMDTYYPEVASACRAKNKLVSFVTKKPGDEAETINTVFGIPSRGNVRFMQRDGLLKSEFITILHRDERYYLLAPVKGVTACIRGEGPGMAFTQQKAQDSTKFLPKLTFVNARKYFNENPEASEYVITDNVSEPVAITRELFSIYDQGLYKTDAPVPEEVYKESLEKILNFYMHFISVYKGYAMFDINLKSAGEYVNSGEFFQELNTQNSTSEWISVDDGLVDDLVEEGKLLMFLITSRNLYSLKEEKNSYVKMFLRALSDDPMGVMLLSNPKFKFRKATIKNPYVHKKGSELINKRNDADNSRIPSEVYLEADRFFNDDAYPAVSSRTKAYLDKRMLRHHKAKDDIIKDKRYTQDQYSISFPISKNSYVINTIKSLDKEISLMANDMNILTAVRSGQDLVYITVTSPEGKLLESRSLNVINGINYWEELKEISDARKIEKAKEWEYGRRVKDNRDAYISLAVSEIAKLVVKYQALVALEMIPEDTKDRFSAFDNNVFKSFEAALVSRLADLHFRGIPAGEPGSVENPYQLCGNTGNDFHDGVVYFVPKSWTGNVDLDTGFVNVFVTENISRAADKRSFLSKFESIKYDRERNRFAFSFDYTNFATKAEPQKNKWTIYAGGPAVSFNKERKTVNYIPETAPYICMELGEYGLDSDFAVLAKEDKLDSQALETLFVAFKRAVSGVLPGHDGKRKQYISPVTEKHYDMAENSAKALTRKFVWYLEDKKTRGEWVDHITG